MLDLEKILRNNVFIDAIRKLYGELEERRDKLIEELAGEIELVNEARDKILERPEYYIDQVCENVESFRGECYFAKDAEEALEFIEMSIGGVHRLLVSDSEEVREISLVPKLREKGYEVFYSSLPHLFADATGIDYPSIYNFKALEEEDILIGLEKIMGKRYRDLEEAENDVANYLKEIFSSVEVGVTGVDALAVDTGSLFLIDYAGDIRLATGAPRTHIALVGIDKIYPTYIEAWTATYLKYRFTFSLEPKGISIISGPSKTGDIEKVTTYGAHGPEKLVVILLDNGRRDFYTEKELRSLNKCISCGICLTTVPVTKAIIDTVVRPFDSLKEIALNAYRLEAGKRNLLSVILTYVYKRFGDRYRCPFGVEEDKILNEYGFLLDEIPDEFFNYLDKFIEKIRSEKTSVR